MCSFKWTSKLEAPPTGAWLSRADAASRVRQGERGGRAIEETIGRERVRQVARRIEELEAAERIIGTVEKQRALWREAAQDRPRRSRRQLLHVERGECAP